MAIVSITSLLAAATFLVAVLAAVMVSSYSSYISF